MSSVDEIKKALSILYDPREVFEVRMLPKGKDSVYSGYFNDIDKCAEICSKMDGIPEGIYTTINPCKPELLARANNRIEPQKGKGNSTTENDILKRKWLMFDIDAKRPSGISASNQEHDLAIKTAYEFAEKLKGEHGFPDAIIGDSGNGAHVEYRIELLNSEENKKLLETFFKVITGKYNNVNGIDIQTFADANRIWKLKGSKVCKGDSILDRPHRRSKLLKVPDKIEQISTELLFKIASSYNGNGVNKEKKTIQQPSINSNGISWDASKLESYLKNNGAIIERIKQDGDITRFILRTCLNNPSHNETSNPSEAHIDSIGKIGYKCHHNSCKDVTWVQVREKIDPEYKKKREAFAKRETKKIEKSNGAFDYIHRITEKTPIYYDSAGQFWVWENGFYRQVDNTEILLTLLKDIGDPSIIQSTFKAELMEAARLMGRDARVKNIPCNWIHIQNGVYDIKSGEIFEPTPNYLFTEPIPHKISNSEDTPIIDKLFKEWVSPEKIPLLYEIAAYCLHNGYPIHRMFVFIGRGRNGKGQYRDLIVNLVGKENRTASTLEQLINSRFETARLFNKKICTMGEINYTLLDRTAILKMLSGGDPIPGEMKNKSPFEFVNTAKLLINTNSLPQTSDKTDAFYSRCIMVEFCNQFQLGKDIIEMIPSEEYNNLLTKSLRILKELLDRGEFTNEGNIRDKEKEYERLSNPLTQFLNIHCEINPNYKEATWRLCELYEKYCIEKGYRKPASKKDFNKMLENNYEIEKKNLIDDITKEHQNWVWIYGYKIKSDILEFYLNYPKNPSSNSIPIREQLSEEVGKIGKMGNTDMQKRSEKLPILPNIGDVILGKVCTTEPQKNDNSVTELTKLLENSKVYFEQNNGVINSSNIGKFSWWFCETYHPKWKHNDQVGDYTPSAIKGIANKLFTLTPSKEL